MQAEKQQQEPDVTSLGTFPTLLSNAVYRFVVLVSTLSRLGR